MFSRTIFGSLIFLVIVMMGCKDDTVADDVKVSVESEFTITPWETLQYNENIFKLNIATIKDNSCENAELDVSYATTGDKINLTIHDIPAPDCPLPFFKASSQVPVGTLVTRDYGINISLKDVVQNEGTVMVTEEYYEVKMNEFDGIKIPNERLYKIPKNTIWGYAAGKSSAVDGMNEFIEKMNERGNIRFYTAGFYGYFSVANNQLRILSEDLSQEELVKTFGLDFEGDPAELILQVESFRNQYPEVTFKIFNANGEVY